MNHSILLNIQDLFNQLPNERFGAFDVTRHLATMAGWSSIIGLLTVLVVLLVLSILNRYHKGLKLNVSGKYLTISFVLVWLAGFVIYDVGMYIVHSRLSLLTNMPMAVIHAFEMFLLQSDVGAIHESFHNNWIYMFAFSLVHMLAAGITLVFVIKHFGYNIIAGFRMLYEAYLGRKKESFIFWGVNDASFLLARSIKNHYDNNKNYRIIIVRTNKAQTTGVKNGMERLFNFLSLRNNDLERLQDLDCLTTSTYSDLAHLGIGISQEDILKKRLDLRLLSRIIGKRTKGKAHLFFLDDNTSENIKSVTNLKRDLTLHEYAKSEGNAVCLYCRARYNSVHRVIEDEQTVDNIEVRVVDPSHICVEILKQHLDLHPVNYVNIERDATISSDFNALVVGFGEVGQDAVRFLYEFGAFVKTGSDSNKVERSGFHCNIVDKNIKSVAGLFAVNAPSISTQMSYDNDSPSNNSPLALHDLDLHSVDFYDHIERWIKTLNYVVIALDDDEENVSLAVRIFRLAVRYRTDMSKLRILAWIKNDEDNHLLHITEHYNRLWAAENHSDDALHIHQHTIRISDSIQEPITLFGSMASTFTWDYIVSDLLKKSAMQFKEKYDISNLAMNDSQVNSMVNSIGWENERKDLMQINGDYQGFSPTFSSIMRLRRIQRQNMGNCFHQLTKRFLAFTALGEAKYSILNGKSLSRRENTTTYEWHDCSPDSSITRVLEVLAQTEHLRWMASHEILGYRDEGSETDKDEARLVHGCLKPWHKLSSLVRSYDYNVVDVSLGISDNANNNINSGEGND